MYVQSQPQRSRGGGAANVLMALLVIILAVVAAGLGWFVARQQAPSPDEVGRYQALAAEEGFRAAQFRGISEGREFAIASQSRITQLKAAIARENARNRGYRKGLAAGLQRPRNRSNYGTGYAGYSGPRYRGPSSNQRSVNSAISSAQSIANATGAPVDVEIYG